MSASTTRARNARLSNLILRLDEERNCAEADLPSGALVVRFRRRVDAAAVLLVIETRDRPAAGHCLLLADGQGAATDTRTIDDDD
jgi:hypothetical protein